MIVYPVGLGMQIFLRMFFPVDPKTGDLVLELEEDERIKNSIEGLRRDTTPLLVRASVFLKISSFAEIAAPKKPTVPRRISH